MSLELTGLLDQVFFIDERINEIKAQIKALNAEKKKISTERDGSINTVRDILKSMAEDEGNDIVVRYKGNEIRYETKEVKKPKKKAEKIDSVKRVLEQYGVNSDTAVEEIFTSMSGVKVSKDIVTYSSNKK